MTTYQVVPAGAHWLVQRQNGGTVSTHRKKAPAVESATSAADAGDEVVIHRMDGTIQDRRRY